MPKYDSSDRAAMLRSYRGTKVYMASHPEVRACFRGRARPSAFGDKVWDTTLRMMRHLEGQSFDSVLEIGCGWGLLGIHLARTSRATVLCSDVDPKLETIVKKHAALNGVEVEFRSVGLADLSDEALGAELIVGSEVCYCEALQIELRALVQRAARAGAKRFLIGDPGRPDFDDLHDFCRANHHTELLDIRLDGDARPSWLLSVRF